MYIVVIKQLSIFMLENWQNGIERWKKIALLTFFVTDEMFVNIEIAIDV